MKNLIMTSCLLFYSASTYAEAMMNLADVYDYSYRQYRAFGESGENEIACISTAITKLKTTYPRLNSQNIDPRLSEFEKSVSEANPLFKKIRFYYATRDDWFNASSVVALEREPRFKELSEFMDFIQSNEWKLKKYLEAKNDLGTSLFRSVSDLKLNSDEIEKVSTVLDDAYECENNNG